MFSRGQSALDLLLGLLILLVVLSIFSGVITRYEEVQREMAIRQQLRDNLSVISLLSSYSSSFYFDMHDHPITNSLPHSNFLYARTNMFVRSTGYSELDPVRGVGVPDPFLCTLLIDINGGAYFGVYAYPIDTLLPYVVDTNAYSALKFEFDENHSFVSSGCFDYFAVEGSS